MAVFYPAKQLRVIGCLRVCLSLCLYGYLIAFVAEFNLMLKKVKKKKKKSCKTVGLLKFRNAELVRVEKIYIERQANIELTRIQE